MQENNIDVYNMSLWEYWFFLTLIPSSIYLAAYDIESDPLHKNIKKYDPDMPIIKKGWDIQNIFFFILRLSWV